MTETTALTTREAAERLDTDPRVLRRFLRETEQGVGGGNRYAIEPKSLPTLKRSFAAWSKADVKAKADRAAAKGEPTPAPTPRKPKGRTTAKETAKILDTVTYD